MKALLTIALGVAVIGASFAQSTQAKNHGMKKMTMKCAACKMMKKACPNCKKMGKECSMCKHMESCKMCKKAGKVTHACAAKMKKMKAK